MERGFEIKTGSVAIGDPTMGLVNYDLGLPPGRYRCDPGALRRPTAKDAQTITLDGPYLFVVDAALTGRFLEWYHRTFNEGFFPIEADLRAAKDFGGLVEPHRYLRNHESALSGRAQEGTYALETRLIVKCD
jgi:hypothetical protein